MQGLVAVIGMAVLAGGDAAKPAPSDLHGGRPLLKVVRQPRFIAAAFCGIVSYPMMHLAVTSAPLTMKISRLRASDANIGIQWHIVPMYAQRFFTVAIIARLAAHVIVP